MTTFTWQNKQKRINTLEAELKTITGDRDKLLVQVKDFEKKTEDFKQSSAAFGLGAQSWETEKKSLLESHSQALFDLQAKFDTELKSKGEANAAALLELQTKLDAEIAAKAQLVKDHGEAVEKLKTEHTAEVTVTDEKINKAVAVKMNSMNLSEGDLPASKDNPTLTIEQARKELASLSGKEQRDYFKRHMTLFSEYMKTPAVANR